ncbi:MAG TPA: helix-turn-helix domain-containing protein [Streptosporangiaceae bacterium]|jgi:AraC-like DNA-binding protein|nr:helix-turn-helix domain-containing protein [Streptosporangiaceae bacterium]
MKTAISLAARELAEQAENLVSQAFVPVRIVPDDEDQFLGSSVRCATAGQVGVSQVTGTFRALRSRALISSTDQELVKVALPTRGRLGVGQGGRQCLVGSDGLVVYDTARPYEVRFGDTCEVVVLGIPRALLGPHAGRLAHRTACAIPIDVGGQRFAAALLRSAASELDTLSGDSSPYLADALISLVLSAISGRPAGGPGQELAGRVFTYCLAHLSDPWLSPGAVAREHGVSVRHLNRVLQSQGITLAAWIRHCRLERIRRDLADPSLAHRNVEQVAVDWGILDATHLSRALRAEFGQSAAQIRRSAHVNTG